MITAILKHELQKLSTNDFRAIKDYYKQKKKGSHDTQAEITKTEKQIEEKTKMSLKLLDTYTKGVIGDEQYKRQNNSLEKELKELIQKKDFLVEKKNNATSETYEEAQTIKKIKALLSMEGWTNEMLKKVVDRIDINMLQNHIEIHYHYLP